MQMCSPARASVVLLSVTNTQILLKVIRVEGPLHFSEDLKHLVSDQTLFAKGNCLIFLGTSLVLSQISLLLILIP